MEQLTGCCETYNTQKFQHHCKYVHQYCIFQENMVIILGMSSDNYTDKIPRILV